MATSQRDGFGYFEQLRADGKHHRESWATLVQRKPELRISFEAQAASPRARNVSWATHKFARSVMAVVTKREVSAQL
jgi:hypothetical protein